MKKARNNAACRNGSRNISATLCGLTSDASVKKPKYVARNVSTSGNLLSRSTVNMPTARSRAIHAQDRSANPPHQLSPLPKAIGAQTSASAAGLKMCSREVRTIRLLRMAKQLVQATTSHDSLVDRMKKMISPLSSALVGIRTRRDSMPIQMPSISTAGSTAANRFGSKPIPPAGGAAMSSRPAKITSNWILGVRNARSIVGGLQVETDDAAVRRHEQSRNALVLEELERALAAQHHCRGRQAICGHRRRRHDRDAGQVGNRLAGARIEDVAFGTRARRA